MALKILVVACFLTLGCLASRSETCVGANITFAKYMASHGKTYVRDSTEYLMREGLFNKRVAEVLSHNAARHSWEMGLNMFSDWTEGELQSLRGYKRRHVGDIMPSSMIEHGTGGDEKPADQPADQPANKPSGSTESMDWSARLATSKDILNQGPCGSCWAVAATAAVQLHAAKAYPNFNKILSPENVNKCAPNPMMCGGEGGCQGSTPELAFKYLKEQGSSGGLYTVDQLKYTAATGMKIPADDCSQTGTIFKHFRARSVQPHVSIADWVQVPTNNGEKVMDTLVNNGPLAVAVVGNGIQGYSRGIISSCKSTVVDHAVVLMGFGKDQKTNMLYWNIRNSWGTEWGENGFFRLKRNYAKTATITGTSVLQGGVGEEPCAWDNDPAKGVACKNDKGEYPKRTWVCGECGIISDVAYPTGVKVHEALLS